MDKVAVESLESNSNLADPWQVEPADNRPKPRLDLARRHIELLTGSPDTPMHFRAIKDEKITGRKAKAENLFGAIRKLWPKIEELQRTGHSVFIVVNEGGTKGDEIKRVRALFVDMDGAPLPAAWHATPDFIVRRDDTHWHAYWLVADMPPAEFTTAQKRLIARYGTDPDIHDLPRIMRLGGSLHLKVPAHPRLVEIEGDGSAYDPLPAGRTATELLAGLPEVAHTERTKLDAPVGDLDTIENVDRARRQLRLYVDRGDVAREGEGGNERTYRLATEIINLGLSEAGAAELIEAEWNGHCLPPWPQDELETIVGNAWRYKQNAAGSWGVSSGVPAEWQAVAAANPVEPEPAPDGGQAYAAANNRFCGRWPDEFEALPDLEFWDEEKTLPKSPDGSVAVLYGDFGTGKTNVVLTMLFDAVLHRGARACYAAGEGAHGVGKNRVPAHCKARGIATRDLRGKFRIVSGVPLFASADEVKGFIDAQRDLAPEIVVIDTLATAIAGEDENSSRAAAFLTDNGPAGQIKRSFKALVILPAHSGKDTAKGIRGNSGFGGNADVILHLEADKPSGAIKLTVDKMRDGRDGFSVYFKVPPSDTPGVPVPVKITEGEYVELVKGSATGAVTPKMTFNERKRALLSAGRFGFNKGLTERQFAERLAGPEPSPDDLGAMAKWETKVETERKSLQNAHRTPTYKGVLCAEQMPEGVSGQGKMQWRWFLPERAAAAPDDDAF